MRWDTKRKKMEERREEMQKDRVTQTQTVSYQAGRVSFKSHFSLRTPIIPCWVTQIKDLSTR